MSQPRQSTVRNRVLKAFSPGDFALPQSHVEHLEREFVQGLVRSAAARGIDPAARLQQFRTLQQAVAAMSQDPVVSQTAEQLVRAIDLTLQELTAVKS